MYKAYLKTVSNASIGSVELIDPPKQGDAVSFNEVNYIIFNVKKPALMDPTGAYDLIYRVVVI